MSPHDDDVVVGGGLSTQPHIAQGLRAFVTPEQLPAVARGIAHIFRDHGYREKRTRARLKYLVADWGWERIANFRGYAVYAKSPLPGVYVSRRLGRELDAEIDLVGTLAPGAVLAEIMPYGGTYTARLKRRHPVGVSIHCLDLCHHNLDFVRERVRREVGNDDGIHFGVMEGGRLPLADASVDVVFLPQILEGVPGRAAFLDEVARVLKPGGRVVATVRNALSWFGLFYLRSVWSGQVPNFGPYLPLPSLQVQGELGRRFRRLSETGISPLPNAIGRPAGGVLRLFSRLYGGVWIKES